MLLLTDSFADTKLSDYLTMCLEIDAYLDDQAIPVRGCSCCSMCQQGAHCYISPCIYA